MLSLLVGLGSGCGCRSTRNAHATTGLEDVSKIAIMSLSICLDAEWAALWNLLRNGEAESTWEI